MNSLIVACGYYQYDMLNINNLFQNGIIMILIPPKLHKINIDLQLLLLYSPH